MKKIVSLVLVLAICLSLCACEKSDTCPYDCDQCAEYEKQAQAAETEDATSDTKTVDQDDNVIKFETPIVVAEDENLRVELVKFCQDYRTFDVHGYPSNANAATEGATLEKYVVFNYCNKTDHALRIELNEIYLGSDSAFSVYARISDNVAAGKKVLREHIIQTGEKETVKSMEELYSLDGDFYVWHVGDDDVSRNRYRLKFSIPNALGGENSNAVPSSVAASAYLGKWQVTDVTFADENVRSQMDKDPELWENFFNGMLDVVGKMYFILSESGDYYNYSGESATMGKWKVTETGVMVGGLSLVTEGNKLTWEYDGYLVYYEKVSDSQVFPET